eukprot:4504238-Prymnesium_polylepis.1
MLVCDVSPGDHHVSPPEVEESGRRGRMRRRRREIGPRERYAAQCNDNPATPRPPLRRARSLWSN